MKKTDKQTSLPLLRKVISGIHSDDQQQVLAELRCPGDFPAFEGHFPGQPVLPGVIQLAVVRSLTSDLVGCSLEPVKTGKLKFTGMIGPNELIRVRVDIKKEGADWLSSFKLDNDGGIVSSGSVLFRKRS